MNATSSNGLHAEESQCTHALRSWIKSPRDQKHIREALNCLLTKVVDTHFSYRSALESDLSTYYPAPLIGHVLNTMCDTCSESFSALHIVARDLGLAGKTITATRVYTVWLPRYKPKFERTEPPAGNETLTSPIYLKHGNTPENDENDETIGLWAPVYDHNPDALVARYVAALMIGVAVSYAPRELVLDFMSKYARKFWGPLVASAFELNGGPLMQTYVEQVRARRAMTDATGRTHTIDIIPIIRDKERWAAEASKPAKILGIDIGGTAIKAGVFEISKSTNPDRVLQFEPCRTTSLAWDQLNAVDIPRNIITVLIKKLKIADDLTAVGISLAAPVSDHTPVGISRVMGKLGYTSYIWEGNPLEIHELDFVKITQDTFKNKTLPVVVLNDGAADIRDSVEDVSPRGGGFSVVFKEGTGVAVAIYEDGKPVPLLAEMAKAPLNVCSGIQKRVPAERFPKGVLSEFCSKRAFAALFLPHAWKVPETLESEDKLNDVCGEFLGMMLEGALSEEMADSCETLTKVLEKNFVGLKCESKLVLKKVRNQLQKFWDKAGDSNLKKLYEEAHRINRQRVYFMKEKLLHHMAKTGKSSGSRLDAGSGCEITFSMGLIPRKWKEEVSDDEKMAIAAAWVLGCWLADALAFIRVIYDVREIRLAGGPLSGKTGIFVTRAAVRALEEVYGFDIVVPKTPSEGELFEHGHDTVVGYRHRQLKRLILGYPPEMSAEGGPRGAAKAAFDGYLTQLKQDQLRRCRNVVADDELKRGKERFTVREVTQKACSKWKRQDPWIITDKEVQDMLAGDASALGLTRLDEQSFKCW